MHGKREDRGVTRKYGRRAVSLVNIQIDDQCVSDLLGSPKDTHGHRNIVQQAIPLAVIGKRMVGPTGKIGPNSIVQGKPCRVYRSLDRQSRSVEQHVGKWKPEFSSSRRTETALPQRFQVLGTVNQPKITPVCLGRIVRVFGVNQAFINKNSIQRLILPHRKCVLRRKRNRVAVTVAVTHRCQSLHLDYFSHHLTTRDRRVTCDLIASMFLKDTPDRRILGLVPASAIVVSSMIGTGIFTTTGLMVSMGAGGGDILLGWLIGGLIALCGALCYGEVGANFPQSGGEYYYLSRLIHPAAGFIAGAVSLIVGFAAPIAASAMAMHLYVGTVITGWPVRTMAAGTILVLALLHAYDLNLGSRFQTVLTAVKLLLLGAFVSTILVGAPGPGTGDSFSLNPNFWTSSAFAVVLVFISFAYSGWNAASYIAAEVRQPERTLPRALLLVTLIVAGTYFLVNLSYLRSVPLGDLSGVEQVAYVVATAAWGPGGGQLVSTLISLTLIAPISAMLLIGPRVAEAMARDGFLPPIFARLNERRVPSYAVMFQAALAIAIALTSSFTALLIYIGFTLNISTALTVISLIRLRQSGKSKHHVCIGYPLPPLIFLVFAVWITIWSIQSQPVSSLAGLATIAVGYIAYLFSSKRASFGGE